METQRQCSPDMLRLNRRPLVPYRRGPVRRRLHVLGHRLNVRLARSVGPKAMSRVDSAIDHQESSADGLIAKIPSAPIRLVARLRSPARPWTDSLPLPPDELRTVAGIRRNPQAEQQIHEQAPLHGFFNVHRDALVALAPVATVIGTEISVAPRLMRANRRLNQRQNIEPTTPALDADAGRLTAQLKAYAAEIGISAVGVTAYDEKYTFAEYVGKAVGQTVVVCALEQNYQATQRIPSHRSEQAALSTYGELEDRMVLLTEWLRDRGWRARPDNVISESVFIAYAVAAGLGQLGLNGQLLTPHAGSRCRLDVLTTNAPLVHDQPVDYGIEGVWDRCQICVRRCPVGAIPKVRKEYRGVVKAKLNTKRCWPLMMQTSGCSICMKVCPVQRYGLAEVLRHYESTDEILGKDTDDLEGYDWPLDGRHYGPGLTPMVADDVMNPSGFHFDAARTSPPTAKHQVGTS